MRKHRAPTDNAATRPRRDAAALATGWQVCQEAITWSKTMNSLPQLYVLRITHLVACFVVVCVGYCAGEEYELDDPAEPWRKAQSGSMTTTIRLPFTMEPKTARSFRSRTGQAISFPTPIPPSFLPIRWTCRASSLLPPCNWSPLHSSAKPRNRAEPSTFN